VEPSGATIELSELLTEADMPTLSRDGTEIHYEVVGHGPTLLITHGYSAASYMWRKTAEALAGRFQVVTWDIRGHGRSASPGDPALYSRAAATGDMAAILDAVGAERAILMGHSLGGYLSLAFHVEHSERVGALVLIGTGPGYRNAESREGWNRQAEARARYFEIRGLAGLDSPEAHGNEHRSAAGLASAARGILAQQDGLVLENLPDIRIPVLIMIGADDTPFLAASEYMEKRIPNARRVVLAGAGHMTNLDQPEAFQQALEEFLTGLTD
jgi:pimeloyl-ACP methyl ester carboxylesterase